MFGTTSFFNCNFRYKPLENSEMFKSSCSRYQRYKLLRANHNCRDEAFQYNLLFQIPKVQTFESQSQRRRRWQGGVVCCSRYQRYKLLRANHNWLRQKRQSNELFQIPKVQTFESQSQQIENSSKDENSCSRYQRYKLLRANHNYKPML